ncbi:hypothetical protein Daus18300_007065 [Diaporthe australafricana]|uniref:Cytochrome b561 domain-containing protein n=1 Tax=Diaporthe australafricana TaxID=127596 RepID=A0ABR3WPV2_9PEZI
MISKLCQCFDSRFVDSERRFDLGQWLSFYAWDVVGNVTFSQPIGYLEKGHDFDGTLKNSAKVQDYFTVVGAMPFLDHWLNKNPIVHVGPPGFHTITGISFKHLADRYQGNDRDDHDRERLDFLDHFIEAKNADPENVDDAQIFSWLMINMLAGADTTALTLKTAFYHCLRDRRIWQRLRDEILAAGPGGAAPISYELAHSLPYLEAVVREALRILPGVSMPLERYVPEEGHRLSNGSFLPGGSMVGVNPYLIARNKGIYGDDAEDFRPERWLRDGDAGETQEQFEARLAAMNNVDLTFGGGRRVFKIFNQGDKMMMRRLNLAGAVLAAAALVAPSLAAQSTFIAPTNSLAFGLSIPDDTSNEDIYFSVAMARGLSWAAVGLGGHKMPGSLMFMIYPSASGKNVTFSPRLATDHTEPGLYAGVDFEVLSNVTGLMNETTYVYSAVCHNCRTWPGGSIDVNSTSQQFMFASGPGGTVGSDSDKASVKLHYEHGAFTMDMLHATGPAGPAVLNLDTADDNEGSALVGKVTEGMNDWVAVIHAVFMIGCFVGLMPFGILILRLGEWVRWHGLNQAVAMIGVIVGLGLGIKAGTMYNRTKSFNTAHQVIGIIVFIFILVQFTLGVLHHRVFKKTQKTTKFAPIHVWLGRAVIILGTVNGFLYVLTLLSSMDTLYN